MFKNILNKAPKIKDFLTPMTSKIINRRLISTLHQKCITSKMYETKGFKPVVLNTKDFNKIKFYVKKNNKNGYFIFDTNPLNPQDLKDFKEEFGEKIVDFSTHVASTTKTKPILEDGGKVNDLDISVGIFKDDKVKKLTCCENSHGEDMSGCLMLIPAIFIITVMNYVNIISESGLKWYHLI